VRAERRSLSEVRLTWKIMRKNGPTWNYEPQGFRGKRERARNLERPGGVAEPSREKRVVQLCMKTKLHISRERVRRKSASLRGEKKKVT